MRPLTRSGAGVLVGPGGVDASEHGELLLSLLQRYRFAVLRQAFPSTEAAVAFLRGFGPINEATTRKDGAVIVEAQEDDEVFRSNGALPLHKDGILTGFDVRIVGIYCVAFQEVRDGRTFVSDANHALDLLSPQDVQLLRENGIEAMAVDRSGYYRQEYGGTWTRFPAFVAAPGRQPSLNIGLPHAEGERESWRVRVAGVSDEVSGQVMGELRRALLDERYLYYHEWREGDLLVMDNYSVLHGREAFQARSRRLANIQVLAS